VGGLKWDHLKGSDRPELGSLLPLRKNLNLYANIRPCKPYPALIDKGETVIKVAARYPEVELEHLLVDAMTMHMLTRAQDFDVVLTENMFGDILTDEASVLAGSMGVIPSASISDGTLGMYEPIHGSAPDIAGQGKANPLAMILSAAWMLRLSFGLNDEAAAIESAVEAALEGGHTTGDLGG